MSQNERIRLHLEAGMSLTPLDALNLFGCLRLAARIKDLRDSGVCVNTHWIEQDDKRYALYTLNRNGHGTS